jgi:hypothetical protein
LVVALDLQRRSEPLFEEAVNLAQFPENKDKKNRDHEQQELDVHSLAL